MSAHKVFSLLTAVLFVLHLTPVVSAIPINPDQLEDRLQDGQICDFVSCLQTPLFPYTSISPITILPSIFPPSPSIHNYLQLRFPIPASTVFGSSILHLSFTSSDLDPSLPSGTTVEYSFDQGVTWQDSPISTVTSPAQLLVRFRFFGSPLATQSGVTGVFNSIQFDPSPTPTPTPTPKPTDTTPPFVFFIDPRFPLIIFDRSPIIRTAFYYRQNKRGPWVLINTDTRFPYLIDWGKTKRPKSGYQLQATATDRFGNIGFSNILTISDRYENHN